MLGALKAGFTKSLLDGCRDAAVGSAEDCLFSIGADEVTVADVLSCVALLATRAHTLARTPTLQTPAFLRSVSLDSSRMFAPWGFFMLQHEEASWSEHP